MKVQEQCKGGNTEQWMGWMEARKRVLKTSSLLSASALCQWKQIATGIQAQYLFQNCRWKIAGSKLGATSIDSIQVTNVILLTWVNEV